MNWYYGDFEYWNLVFELKMPHPSKYPLEKYIDISAQLIEWLHTYELACFYSSAIYHTKGLKNVIAEYKKEASEALNPKLDMPDEIVKFLFCKDIWPSLGQSIIDDTDAYRNGMTKVYLLDENGKLQESFVGRSHKLLRSAFYPNINYAREYDLGGYSPIDLEFGFPFTEGGLFFNLSSYSNMWFEEIQDFDADQSGATISNRVIAYRMSPRLNSLVRKVQEMAVKVDASFNFFYEESSFYKKYITPNGILLDGQLIYQEDIDSGKIKLPE